MAKSQRQIRKSQRIATRGRTDLTNGFLNSRSLRFALQQGRYVMGRGRPPEPPPEWREWKRVRFTSSIRAAHLFLKGKELDEIALQIEKPDATRQRISQMVGDGVKFFLDRGFVRAV